MAEVEQRGEQRAAAGHAARPLGEGERGVLVDEKLGELAAQCLQRLAGRRSRRRARAPAAC
ncbi:hypothetical protein LUX33_48015 [Actinomadura madurae]|nr:hypothetical protein [Actinomadura madurae]